jgi:hypothetical protein
MMSMKGLSNAMNRCDLAFERAFQESRREVWVFPVVRHQSARASRLRLRLEPVAVLIGKALVEIPPKFAGRPPVNPKARAEAVNGELRAWKGAQGLAEAVRYYGRWMRDEAEKRIGHLYPKATLPDGSDATVIAWLWARTVRSPDPGAKGAMVPLVSSFMLSTKEGKKAWVQRIIDTTAPDGWRFEVRSGTLSREDERLLAACVLGCRGDPACSPAVFLCLCLNPAPDIEVSRLFGPVTSRDGNCGILTRPDSIASSSPKSETIHGNGFPTSFAEPWI